MNAVFVGAVEGSRIALEALIRAGDPPRLVITLPRELGHRHSDFVDLTVTAKAAGCEMFYTANINARETLHALAAVNPDVCLVIGWSQICREAFRTVARLGSVGYHPSLLPKLRGRAVIPWTILLDERTTGSTLFWLDDGVDSGDILLQQAIPVAEDETARSLYDKHKSALAKMLPEAMVLIRAGSAPRIHQDHTQATYCARRTGEDGLIDWNEPATSILRLIRAVGDPYPGAFSFQNGERLVIHEACHLPSSHRYVGIIGQVQCHTEGGFAIRCGDGECIDVHSWSWEPADRPRVHSKLGGAGQ